MNNQELARVIIKYVKTKDKIAMIMDDRLFEDELVHGIGKLLDAQGNTPPKHGGYGQ